jgi:FkbM family methyltransferase
MKLLFKEFFKLLLKIPAISLQFIYFSYESILNKLIPGYGYNFREKLINYIDNESKTVSHKSSNAVINFILHTPNTICNWRHSSFSYKEPEMLDWIEQYGGNGAFYDIGANIGIYSLYYAKKFQNGNVYSFEPSVFNLRQLAKNISANALSDKITIISNPLSEDMGVSLFKHSNSNEGGALSSFGVDYGDDAKPITVAIEYNLLGFSLDSLLEMGAINEPPSLIKIDVDGIEHLILKGAQKTLSLNKCKSVYIEVNDEFEDQSSGVKKILQNTGFHLKEKRHGEMSAGSPVFNQIWVK